MREVLYKCPYCLHEYPQSSFQLRAVNELINEIRCPNNTPDANNRVCNKVLPLNFFEGKSHVISIIGGKNVGKTYYSVVLLDLILNCRPLHKFGISGTVIGSEQLKEEINTKLNQLGKGEFFDLTTLKNIGETLVLQISIGKGKKTKYVYLSFFDNPGEGFSNIDLIIENLPNVYRSDALIFMFEPRQISALQVDASANATYHGRQIIDDVYTVLNNTIEILKHINRNRNSNQKSFFDRILKNNKVNEPVAICISKFDQVEHLFYNQIPSDNEELDLTVFSNNGIRFDTMRNFSNEIQNTLYADEYGDFRLKNMVEASLSKYSYFGVQSIKIVDDKPMCFPKGVVLPLIWLFKQLNLI